MSPRRAVAASCVALVFGITIADAAVASTIKKGETIALSPNSDGPCSQASISEDGRWVAFASSATNLSHPSGDGNPHVLLRDVQRKKTWLVSSDHGVLAEAASSMPCISGDGRWIVFRTGAPNFPGANGKKQLYRHDRRTKSVKLVSAGADGAASSLDVGNAALDVSRNGRFVVFCTPANLVGGIGNGKSQAYRRDLKQHVTELVSVSPSDGLANENILSARISDDGRFVVFTTLADDVADEGNGFSDVFVRDMKRGETTLISRTPGGGSTDFDCVDADVSGNGRFVAFVTRSTILVPGDAGADRHVIVIDRKKGARRAIHAQLDPELVECVQPRLSRSGKSIAFDGFDINDPFDDDDDVYHGCVARTRSGAVEQVNVDSDGIWFGSNSNSNFTISGDGRRVAFTSDAAGLDEFANTHVDVFLRRIR